MFKPVDPKTDFVAMEERVLKFWQDNSIYQKSVDSRSPDNE